MEEEEAEVALARPLLDFLGMADGRASVAPIEHYVTLQLARYAGRIGPRARGKRERNGRKFSPSLSSGAV